MRRRDVVIIFPWFFVGLGIGVSSQWKCLFLALLYSEKRGMWLSKAMVLVFCIHSLFVLYILLFLALGAFLYYMPQPALLVVCSPLRSSVPNTRSSALTLLMVCLDFALDWKVLWPGRKVAAFTVVPFWGLYKPSTLSWASGDVCVDRRKQVKYNVFFLFSI